MRDLIRRRLDNILHRFTPSVSGDLYDLAFVPVLDHEPSAAAFASQHHAIEAVDNCFVIAIRVAKGTHHLQCVCRRLCWVQRFGH